jgi:hypothetical protein
MGFCTNCGTQVDGDFCGNCGMKQGSPAAPGGQIPSPAPEAPPSYSSTPPVNIAAPKKRGPLFWVLSGCGALVVLAGIAVLVFFFFVYRVAKQAGLDPELMQKNPAMAVAKMMAAVNPDIEVLAVDDARGIIKVRDKKTGKTLTMNLEDVKKGKITFQDDESGKVEIQAQGEGENASINIKGVDGSVTVGTNTKLPDWLPNYPGAKDIGNYGLDTKEGNAANFYFKTDDPVEKVLSFYEEKLKAAGLEVERQGQELGSSFMLTAKDAEEKRTATVTAGRQDNVTTVTVLFESKK